MVDWARMLTRTGLVLLVIGTLPLFAASVFPAIPPLLPGLLSITVAPLGILVMILAGIVALVQMLRK